MSDNLSSIEEDDESEEDSKQEAKNSSLRSMFSDTTDESFPDNCYLKPDEKNGMCDSFPIYSKHIFGKYNAVRKSIISRF
jgi:hypothetical protein